jgi:hypothetical protein
MGFYVGNFFKNKKYVRFDVVTAVTTMNAVFWDIKTQFIPHRRHISLHYRAQSVNAM